MKEPVLVTSRRQTDGGTVETLRLNRPRRKNALSPRLVSELIVALDTAIEDDTVRVIVLEGEGETFCAGADLGGSDDDSQSPLAGDFADLLRAMVRAKKPIVAKVKGHAVGGGVGLVAAAHFALATRTAVFSTPEVKRGLWPMMIMAVLARTVRRRELLEMMLLGARFDAERAVGYGLINRTVDDLGLDDEVKALADELATRSPTAVARGLEAWAAIGDLSLDEALPFLRDELYSLFATEDAREGMAAFIEKRAPRWLGR